MVKKVNKAVDSVIWNKFSCKDPDTFIPFYKRFVIPHIECASVVWSPTFKKNIIAVERRTTKNVTGLKDLPYLRIG